jgi:putative oxidoreductase
MIKTNIDIGLLILRLAIDGLMLLHGLGKIGTDLDFIEGLMEKLYLPAFTAKAVYIGEIVAPILMIIGFKTRFAALIFFMTCLFIILVAHPTDVFKLNDYGAWALELVGLYAFGSLALIFTGGGKYAVSQDDRLIPVGK